MKVIEPAHIEDADVLNALASSLHIDSNTLLLASRRPSEYASSHRLEEIDVKLPSGLVLSLLLKEIGYSGLSELGRTIRPGHLYSTWREPAVYQHIFEPNDLDTARLYGCREDSKTGSWLLLERIDGVELYQIGDLTIWQAVARWLAVLHRRFSPSQIDPCARKHLLVIDRNYLLQWPERALSIMSDRASVAQRSALTRLSQNYAGAVDVLLDYPSSLIHGEFYASNVLVGRRPDNSPRIVAVDWEMAAIGPSIVDLAALTSGHWTSHERDRIVMAYAEAASWRDRHDISRCLKFAQLHQSWQWLGWSESWTPPASQTQDWLGQALQLGEELGML